ncbi:DHH [Mytilus coruscus]|uniref:DHH n=1 Tax=Mytilus coruscus TaxID=42192 RepID=A0A6J8BUJ3_MYTCO|nr:DHH [Mytilus coruscus]
MPHFICIYISRWLPFVGLLIIHHTTSLPNENCNNDRHNERVGSDNKDECKGIGDVENGLRKYSENVGSNEWMSLPENEKQLHNLFLSGKRHPAMKMADIAMKMKRSPNQVFFLLVGLTGSGKSSTVNYLFDKNIAETGDSKSVTHSTTEYILKLKSVEWRIPDLKLSIIDTPGFGDTEGLEKDARNIMSIKRFFESHPNIRKNSYPNLVMIVQNIMDNRIEGESSNFVKMLKGLSKVGVIDIDNPNVVVVLTHVTSIARNPKCWDEKVQKRKEEVTALVRLHLLVNPEIVVQENLPQENDLERDGDWFLLPNGDKQPKILYRACESILNRVGDKIGHEAMAVAFRPGSNKDAKKGHSMSASEITLEDIQAMHSILLQSIVKVPTSEVGSMLENYKKQKKMKSLDNDILILQVRFRDLHIFKTSDLQNMSMNKLMTKLYPVRITKEMQQVLQEVFGLSYDQVAGLNYHVGKGYNIFKDSTTLKSPLAMTDCNNQYGLPANVQLKECSSFEVKFDVVENTKEYVTKRLRELNIQVDEFINFEAFNNNFRSGYNKGSSKIQSFSVEHRIRQVIVREPYQMNEEFITDVKDLPLDYNLEDETSVMKWKAFFDKWGMYVVIGEYIGGSITCQVKVEEERSIEDVQIELAKRFSFIQGDTEFDFSKADKQSTFQEGFSSIHSTSCQWNGGNKETYKTSLENIYRSDWKAWVESLEYSPVPLWSSLDLYPLYHIADKVSKEKSITMQRAMNLALKGEFSYQPPKADNRFNTAQSNEAGWCFHEDSVVLLPNAKVKRMKDLAVGDKVLTLDSKGNIVLDEVITWLHRLRTGQFTFLKIVHDLGEFILSSDHVLFVGENSYPQHASTVSPGDKLSFLKTSHDSKTVSLVTVLSIQTVNGTGVYAPLTYNGRLLVDNVDVSCYSTLNPPQVMGRDLMSSHALAHVAFLPLRMAFNFGLDINDNEYDDGTGIHGYARWLMKLYLT